LRSFFKKTCLRAINEEHHKNENAERTHQRDWFEDRDGWDESVIPEPGEDGEENNENNDKVEPEDNHFHRSHRSHH